MSLELFKKIMKLIKYPFILLWRVWFYVIILITIVVLSPILIVVTYHEKHYPYFYKMAHYWGKLIVFLMGFKIRVLSSTPLITHKSYMLSPNHTSLIDAMVLLAIVPHNPFVFVGKIELKKIPIFGYFYRKTCILVDRNDKTSRASVYSNTLRKLKYGYSICIFPEGGVPQRDKILDKFKDGAFKMSIEHNIPIVPFSFLNFKEHMSWKFFSGGPGTLLVKMHDPIPTDNLTMEDMEDLKQKVREIILKDLEDYESNRKVE